MWKALSYAFDVVFHSSSKHLAPDCLRLLSALRVRIGSQGSALLNDANWPNSRPSVCSVDYYCVDAPLMLVKQRRSVALPMLSNHVIAYVFMLRRDRRPSAFELCLLLQGGIFAYGEILGSQVYVEGVEQQMAAVT